VDFPQVDPTSLAKRSKEKQGESLHVVLRKDMCRISGGARSWHRRRPSFFVEVVITPCRGTIAVDLESFEKILSLMKTLEKRGYALNCQDDGSISCEIMLRPQELNQELRAVVSATREILD